MRKDGLTCVFRQARFCSIHGSSRPHWGSDRYGEGQSTEIQVDRKDLA